MYRPFYSAEYSTLYFSVDEVCPERAFSGALNVFVCGALQDPLEMSALLGQQPAFAPAAAIGYRRTVERIHGKDVPFMVADQADPRSVLTGVVWLDLTPASLEKIDSLELEGGFRRRVAIEARIGELDLNAFTYVKQ